MEELKRVIDYLNEAGVILSKIDHTSVASDRAYDHIVIALWEIERELSNIQR